MLYHLRQCECCVNWQYVDINTCVLTAHPAPVATHPSYGKSSRSFSCYNTAMGQGKGVPGPSGLAPAVPQIPVPLWGRPYLWLPGKQILSLILLGIKYIHNTFSADESADVAVFLWIFHVNALCTV